MADAHLWRARAAKFRKMAETIEDEIDRAAVVAIADRYESWAAASSAWASWLACGETPAEHVSGGAPDRE